jgi:hypothetical protein
VHEVTEVPQAGDLTVDLSASTTQVNGQTANVGERAVEVPVSVLQVLDGANRNVVINAGVAELQIPPQAFTGLQQVQGQETANVRIGVRAVDPNNLPADAPALMVAVHDSMQGAAADGLQPASQVLLFSAQVTTKDGTTTAVTHFNTPITVRIPFTSATNPEHLGVYRRNPVTNEWEFRGGRVNVQGGYIEVELDGFSEYAVFEFTKTFADVTADHWAKADIELMAARHVVNGLTDAAFEPAGNVTRAQFAAMIVRALRLQATSATQSNFSDVATTDWFFQDVQTAAQAGIVAGAEGVFRPGDLITRQEMAIMLSRAMKLRKTAPEVNADKVAQTIGAYEDASQVGDWAKEAITQATATGLMTGRTQTTFAPGANANRAEAVVVLKRLLKLVGDL